MPATGHSISDAIAVQLACQRCPLHRSGPIPVSVPLHVIGQAPLVVLPRPLGDPVSPRADLRFRTLHQSIPALADSCVTYATSCWSPPSEQPPARAVDNCIVHRKFELRTLAPSLLLLVGELPCRMYLDAALDDVLWQSVNHAAGMPALPVADPLTTAWSPEQTEHVRTWVNATTQGVHHDLG